LTVGLTITDISDSTLAFVDQSMRYIGFNFVDPTVASILSMLAYCIVFSLECARVIGYDDIVMSHDVDGEVGVTEPLL
jgi:hypothetical protein